MIRSQYYGLFTIKKDCVGSGFRYFDPILYWIQYRKYREKKTLWTLMLVLLWIRSCATVQFLFKIRFHMMKVSRITICSLNHVLWWYLFRKLLLTTDIIFFIELFEEEKTWEKAYFRFITLITLLSIICTGEIPFVKFKSYWWRFYQ